MTGESSYRLGDFRIIVYDDVLLRWERHAALGMAQSGRCYLLGDVLVIGEKNRDEDGFLIGEFHDMLQKLPAWTMTRYYCHASGLLDTGTGQSINGKALARFSFPANGSAARSKKELLAGPGEYRLGHYQITAVPGGGISWKAYGDGHRIVSGSCSIESGILVVGPRERDDPGTEQRNFSDSLAHLRPWNETAIWCHASVLQQCRDMLQKDTDTNEVNIVTSGKIPLAQPSPRWGEDKGEGQGSNKPKCVCINNVGMNRLCAGLLNHPVGSRPALRMKAPEETAPPLHRKTADIDRFKRRSLLLLMSGWTALVNAWQRAQKGMVWLKWPVVLLVVLVLLGLTAALIIAGKGSHWMHDPGKHHHDHHDD